MFNRKYIFKWSIFQQAMLFTGVYLLKPPQFLFGNVQPPFPSQKKTYNKPRELSLNMNFSQHQLVQYKKINQPPNQLHFPIPNPPTWEECI